MFLSVVLWILVAVFFQTDVAANSNCSKKYISTTHKCEIQYALVPRSPLFKTDEKTFLNTYMLRLLVSSKNATKECSVSVDIEGILRRSFQNLKQPRIVTLGVLCKDTARVSFCRPDNFIANDIISYLSINQNCRVTDADLAVWGQATDLRVLYLMGDVIVENSAKTKDDLKGLFNIGTVILHNVKIIPRMLLTYVWNKMAEIQLSKMQLGSSLNILKTTMPNLQSLELSHNNLTSLPAFPWCNTTLELPRNLSRTFIMNAHYSEGASINPRLYRRFLVVHFNPGVTTASIHSGYLDKISLRGNNLNTINSTMFNAVTGLKIVDLSLNKLSTIPEGIFDKTPDLVAVNLANNNLTWLNGKIFEGLKNLRDLDVRNNFIHRLENGFLTVKLGKLESIHFENNSMHVVEEHSFPRSVFDALKKINFAKNKLREVPQFGLYVRNLDTYDLSENKINYAGLLRTIDAVHIQDFLYVHTSSGSSVDTRSPADFSINSDNKKVLNLQHNAIERFDLTDFNKTGLIKLEYSLKIFKILLTGNPLHCDCKMLELQLKLLNWSQIYTEIAKKDFETWVCHTPNELHGMKILDVPPEAFRCETDGLKCPRECGCYRSDANSVTLVDCRRRNLTKAPDKFPNGIVELHLEHNQIENLTLSKNMENVTLLYASHNNIQHVDLKDRSLKLKEIYLDSNRLSTIPKDFQNLTLSKINLQNNYFTCDCGNVWMKGWLNKREKAFVGGARSVVCSSGNTNQAKPLVLIKDEDFVCKTSIRTDVTANENIKAISSYVIAGFLFVLLIWFALIYRFRKELKLIMYTRFNWHPFDRSDDSDPSKIYDAFVSFNIRDKQWVKETLQAQLENNSPAYKLCIHYRDFIPGATIADNILENVKKSRRMIMVLSNNFIQSEWCMLEFRAAHRRVLKGRANYLIIVLFDDVDVENLDEELKLYLKTNTYLNVNSKWFWRQLKYALPQKQSNPSGGVC